MRKYRWLPGLLACAVIILALTVRTLLLTSNAASAARLPAPAATTIVYLPLVMKNFTPSATVSLLNIAYNPNSLTIHVGNKVVWTNNDPVAHTVTSGQVPTLSGLFDSGNMNTGQTFQFTFNSTGNFSYFCEIHTFFMTGTINVIP